MQIPFILMNIVLFSNFYWNEQPLSLFLIRVSLVAEAEKKLHRASFVAYKQPDAAHENVRCLWQVCFFFGFFFQLKCLHWSLQMKHFLPVCPPNPVLNGSYPECLRCFPATTNLIQKNG